MCRNVQVDPCTAQCGHTICQLCLAKLWKPRSTKCPLCKELWQVPPAISIDLRYPHFTILLFYSHNYFSLILLYLGIILRALMVTRYRQSEVIILMKTTNSLQTFYISKNIQIQHKNRRQMVKLYGKKPTMKVCL